MYTKVIIVLSTILLTACAFNDDKVNDIEVAKLLNDQPFANYQTYQIESEKDIYALDQDMINFVHGSLMAEQDPFARSRKLLKKLFHSSPTDLRYMNGANLTAREAFHQNTANCLSLTILAYALAREAHLQIQFQEIEIPEYWIREGDFNLLTGHVNLKVVGDSHNGYRVVWGGKTTTIDFDPYVVKKHFPKDVIGRKRVTSMFYNNKGAQALVSGDYDLSYAYFKKSIEADKSFAPVWGNLGLLYKKVGYESHAEQAYLASVTLDGKNYNAWNNLAILVGEQGRSVEAAKIYRFIEKERRQNPYYYALLGDEAYHNGNYEESIRYYKRAKSMLDDQHEFYFGLSRSFYMMGDYELAEFYLSKAKKHAAYKDIKEQYQSKLKLLSKL
ncbi:hypothetical protein E2K93_17230 [Thalassotalea sp. HSM 43]|uniref:tetratricopeptide repeat protein n=1 Tax=Thalassotalea sp. HSM 43 TaxID=2552945 RepID=UPI0010822E27|nr:hypothetical protein [Thalassotalea sp. HSM 43]QBY05999.1 hypothetical protein E2K93_17230 [Thalassotalea sp. HSM 43]